MFYRSHSTEFVFDGVAVFSYRRKTRSKIQELMTEAIEKKKVLTEAHINNERTIKL